MSGPPSKPTRGLGSIITSGSRDQHFDEFLAVKNASHSDSFSIFLKERSVKKFREILLKKPFVPKLVEKSTGAN